MKSPAAAVLWESWRLSRFSLVTLMFCSIVGGAILVIALETRGERLALLLAAFVALVLTPIWTLRLRKGGGFPMTLAFNRPIATWILVGVPMAYVAASAAVVFLVPTLMLTAAFGLSLPLLPAAAVIVTGRFVLLAASWWTGSAAIGFTGWMIAYLLAFRRLFLGSAGGNDSSPGAWMENLTVSADGLGVMALVVASSVGLTVFGVARQRRGDDGFGSRSRATPGAAARRFAIVSRLSDLIRLPCPVSSPMAAQAWYEMRTGGARVLSRGIMSAMGFALVVLIASPLNEESGGYFYANTALVWGLAMPVIAGARSVLGVRRTQGKTYLSSFDAIRPAGTGRLIGLKVAIASAGILLSWVAMVTAFWVLPTDFMGLGPKRDFTDALRLATSVELVLAALIPPLFVVALMAYAVAIHALFLRNPRGVVIGGQVVGIYLVGMIYALATDRVTDSAMLAQLAVVTVAGVVVTLHLYWRVLSERILGAGGLTVAVALGIFLGAGGRFYRPRVGGSGADAGVASMLPLAVVVLVPLLALVLAPWSFARIRHR
jgi:hypothetical protein